MKTNKQTNTSICDTENYYCKMQKANGSPMLNN